MLFYPLNLFRWFKNRAKMTETGVQKLENLLHFNRATVDPVASFRYAPCRHVRLLYVYYTDHTRQAIPIILEII